MPKHLTESVNGTISAIHSITGELAHTTGSSTFASGATLSAVAGAGIELPYLENVSGNTTFYICNDLEADITTIASTATTLVIADAQTLSANATFPSTLSVIILNGGSIDGAHTLTINGPFEAGLYEVFGSSLTVTFGPGVCTEVYPEWWGENTTPGTTDMTAEVQAAINTQFPVKLGVSRYYITDTLTFPNISGLTIDYGGIFSGSGNAEISSVLDGSVIRGTVLVTPATFAKPLFYAYGSRNLHFRDFAVVGPGKGDVGSIAFHFNHLNRHWKIESVNLWDWETGIQCSDSAVGAQGNDSECMFDNVCFGNITYCTRMYNSQAYNWHFYGCTFGETTDYTCKVEDAGGGYYGNRIRIHGGFVGSAVKIFDVTSAYGMVYVSGAHFESGAVGTDPPVIFDAGIGGSTAPVSCVLVGNEFNYEACLSTTTVPFIQSNSAGPIIMVGNKIAHPNPIINVQQTVTLTGNFWHWEPRIYRSDAPYVHPPVIQQGEQYLYYNGIAGDNVLRVPLYIGYSYAGRTTTYGTAVPTTGSFKQGSLHWKTDVVAGGSAGWVCTANGTYSAATDATGDTDGSTAVITGMTDTTDFHVGEYVTVSAGFVSVTLGYRILEKTATTITLDSNSIGASNNVTVATPDPVWKAMANIAA